VWDTKYRPLRFSDVLGQPGAVQILKSRLRNGTALDTSYLFCGGPGQGKTTLARILARAVLCQQLNKEDPDPCNECDNCRAVLTDTSTAFVEKDAASQGTIDHMRRIVEELPFAVFGAPKRVYLFDECHRMSKDAQDVLLKPLEEKKMVGMFCTTEPEKVRGAIRSRCEEYAIRKVTREDILVRMRGVLQSEGVEFEDDAVLIVIDYSGGHVRDVLNRLEMVAQMGPVTVESVRDHLNLSVISTYYEILLNLFSNTKEALILIDKACERVTPEEVASGIAEAAMNAYRLASGMVADFTFSDKALGAKAHQLYGDGLVKIAEHFVQSRRNSTHIGLVCDVVALAGGMPVAPSPAFSVPLFSPPSPGPSASPPPSPSASPPSPSASPPSPSASPPSSGPSPNPPSGPASPARVVVSPSGAKYVPQPIVATVGRPDGVGNLSSGDPCALSELDAEVIQVGYKPNGSHTKKQLIHYGQFRAKDGRDILPSSVWKRGFESLWLTRGQSDS